MRRALPVLLLTLCASGCAWFRMATGPKWSEDAVRLESEPVIADHRSKDRLVFLVFGDAGTGKADQRRVAERMLTECEEAGGCDFALMAGDNIYESGVRSPTGPKLQDKFEIPYEGFGRLDFWAAAGNHDYYRKGSVDAQVRYSLLSTSWRMLGRDYAVPRLPEWMRIYALDTTPLVSDRDLAQVDRAREHLCGGDGWKLLLGHHPVYSSGMHADAGGVSPEMRDRLVAPLIEPCGVHLYLSGHEHHQEHLSAPDFDQVVQGAAGKLRRVRAVEPRVDDVHQHAAASRFGFALVRATADELELRFFGYSDTEPYGELHCRIFDGAAFDRVELRSRPCGEISR